MTTTYGQISVSILEMDSHGQIKMKVENFKQEENLKDFVYQELFSVDNVSIELQLVEEILDDDTSDDGNLDDSSLVSKNITSIQEWSLVDDFDIKSQTFSIFINFTDPLTVS